MLQVGVLGAPPLRGESKWLWVGHRFRRSSGGLNRAPRLSSHPFFSSFSPGITTGSHIRGAWHNPPGVRGARRRLCCLQHPPRQQGGEAAKGDGKNWLCFIYPPKNSSPRGSRFCKTAAKQQPCYPRLHKEIPGNPRSGRANARLLLVLRHYLCTTQTITPEEV